MEEPLVSIITPSHNAEAYIAETIRSVQNQTYSNWEMLITDDASTDQTPQIVNQFALMVGQGNNNFIYGMLF